MILYINTADSETIELKLVLDDKILAKKSFLSKFRQSEKLLPEIEKILTQKNISLKSIKKIKVENQGSSFTSLRIGVIVANALGYALEIPVEPVNLKKEKIKRQNDFSVVKPEYDREPNITMKKK